MTAWILTPETSSILLTESLSFKFMFYNFLKIDQRRLPGSGGTRARAGKKQEGRGGYWWQKGCPEPRPRGEKTCAALTVGLASV